MQENKKPKIVVVGVGNAGCNVVDLISQKPNPENVSFIRVDMGELLDDREKNPRIKDIGLKSFSYTKLSAKELLSELDNPLYEKEEILRLLSMVEDGDEIYQMDERCGCFAGDLIGFKLIRDGKTIAKTRLFQKAKAPPPQNQTKTIKSGWIEKIFDFFGRIKR